MLIDLLNYLGTMPITAGRKSSVNTPCICKNYSILYGYFYKSTNKNNVLNYWDLLIASKFPGLPDSNDTPDVPPPDRTFI